MLGDIFFRGWQDDLLKFYERHLKEEGHHKGDGHGYYQGTNVLVNLRERHKFKHELC